MASNPGQAVAEKYGLQRENFILDPLRDFECFARVDIDTRSSRRISIQILSQVWHPSGYSLGHTEVVRLTR